MSPCASGSSSTITLFNTSLYYTIIHVGMKHHYHVSSLLMDLDNRQIIQVGLALGMNYAKLQRMSSLPGDMVAAWLRGEDDVLQVSGVPTWKTLSEALKDVGQTGLAVKIQHQHGPSKGNDLAKSQEPQHTCTTVTRQTSTPQGTVCLAYTCTHRHVLYL